MAVINVFNIYGIMWRDLFIETVGARVTWQGPAGKTWVWGSCSMCPRP